MYTIYILGEFYWSTAKKRNIPSLLLNQGRQEMFWVTKCGQAQKKAKRWIFFERHYLLQWETSIVCNLRKELVGNSCPISSLYNDQSQQDTVHSMKTIRSRKGSANSSVNIKRYFVVTRRALVNVLVLHRDLIYALLPLFSFYDKVTHQMNEKKTVKVLDAMP